MALKHAFAAAIIALGALLTASAFAQTSSVRFQIGGTARVDCERPVKVNNFPLAVEGRGVRTGRPRSASPAVTAFIWCGPCPTMT